MSYSWREILGSGFLRDFEVGRIGEAIKNYWFDGRNYFMEDGKAVTVNVEDASSTVYNGYDLSARPGRHECV